jgi:protein-arginine kinase activator protein McsA
VRALRAQLREAVTQEAYEDAARLRDEIRELEQSGKTSEE